jgi:hypothetical protein
MMKQDEFINFNSSKGFHWFDKGSMAFFRSRVSNWDSISGLFISSERGPNGGRAYSIRKADFETGNVSTIGKFQAYDSIGSAKTALRRLLRNG